MALTKKGNEIPRGWTEEAADQAAEAMARPPGVGPGQDANALGSPSYARNRPPLQRYGAFDPTQEMEQGQLVGANPGTGNALVPPNSPPNAPPSGTGGVDPMPTNPNATPFAPGIYGDGTALVNQGQFNGPIGPTGLPVVDTNPNLQISNIIANDRGVINAQGQQINREALTQLGHYGGRQTQYEGKSDEALDQLKATPGYTGTEAGQINADYGANRTADDNLWKQYLSPEEQAKISGDPNAAAGTLERGLSEQGTMLNNYQGNLSGQVGNYASYTGSGLDRLTTGLDAATGKLDEGLQGAVGRLGSGLDAAQSKFGKLDEAVSDPSLAFDPNSTEKQLTDADVQDMKTAAGTRVGNQYRSAEDSLYRNAAAEGNTSPMALAAANARLQHQSAADMGDAEVSADIGARQAQYERAAGIEGQRLGAANTSVGYRSNAALAEQQAAQQAAALTGTADVQAAGLAGTTGVQAAGLSGTEAIKAAEAVGQTGINAANQYGQFSTDTVGQMAGQRYGAATTAEQLGSNRAAYVGSNRQTQQANVNNTRYAQGMETTGATAQGAQAVGNARIAGQGAYRTGVAQQQGAAQQGGQQAVTQQLGAFGTQTGGLNNSAQIRANYETQKPTVAGQAATLIGAVTGAGGTAAKALGYGAEGGMFTEPEMRIIGEAGPELVQPMGGYGRSRMVDRPTLALLGDEGPEEVVPMNNNPSNKVTEMSRYRRKAA